MNIKTIMAALHITQPKGTTVPVVTDQDRALAKAMHAWLASKRL